MLSPIKYHKYILPALFLLFILGQVAYVWWLPWFPTQDGPCHFYNLVILRDLRNGGHAWGTWFEQHLTMSSNLGFHFIAYPLISLVSPLSAEKIFISIYIIIFSTSIPLSLKMLDLPRFPWSFLVIPVVWSYSLAMGFYSFIITLPLLILSMALTIRMRTSGLTVRFIIICMASALLLFFHLIPFACFALFVLISILVDDKNSVSKRLITAIILLMPSAAALAWYMAVSAGSPHIRASSFLKRLPFLITDILTCSTIFFSPLQIVSGTLLGLLLYVLLKNYAIGIGSDYIQKVFGLYAIAIAVLALVSPPSLGGGAFLNERLPTVMLMVLIPLIASRDSHYDIYLKNVLIPVVAVVLIINSVLFYRMSSLVTEFMSARHLSLKAGSVVMPYRDFGLPDSRVDVLVHAISHYATKNGLVDAGNYQQQFAYFLVHYRPAYYTQMPSPDQVNYRKETIDFDKFGSVRYLFVWDTVLSPKNLTKFRKIYQNRKLSVWERFDAHSSH